MQKYNVNGKIFLFYKKIFLIKGGIIIKKSDLVKAIIDKVDITADKAGKIINIVFETITKALENGDSYNHDKFGTFKVVDRAPRKGRNPQTSEVVDIPEKKAVKLVVSGYLKKQINKEDK